jgi:phosphate transport system substrate-binding protein
MAFSASARTIGKRLLCLALFGLFIVGPISVNGATPAPPADGSPVLRIHGSNTVGAKLAPMLIAGLFEAQGLGSVRIVPAGRENEQRVTAIDGSGRTIHALVAAHGTGTGFAGLKDGSAELAAASRPIKDSEFNRLAALGDLRSVQAEQIIAIDGLAIIVHPNNRIASLSVEQVAALFAGEIKNWQELGGDNIAVELHARDDQSGTYDTFKELVLGTQSKTLDAGAARYESNDQLSKTVSSRPGAIGFVGLASVGDSKAVRSRCCPPPHWSQPKTIRCRAACSSTPTPVSNRLGPAPIWTSFTALPVKPLWRNPATLRRRSLQSNSQPRLIRHRSIGIWPIRRNV